MIVGSGSYVPSKVLSNKDLERMVETTDEWIFTRTGIRERRLLNSGEGTADMAYHASVIALREAGIKKEKIELIVFGTVSPDLFMPSAACLLQDKLGAKNAVAFDVSAACAGFLYSMVIAEGLLSMGRFRNALVVGADTLSRFTDYSQRSTCVLFGDGAGASVAVPGGKTEGLLAWRIYTDGSYWKMLNIPGGGSLNPPSIETVKKKMHFIRMEGKEIFKLAVKAMEEACESVLCDAGLKVDDVALFIPHQANLRIILTLAERLRIEKDRVFLNIERYGNTSAASIPIAIDEALRSRRIKKGDYILFATFGAGLAWGAALIKW